VQLDLANLRIIEAKSNRDIESCYTRLIQSGDLNNHVLFESQLADVLVNAGTILIYLTGLIGFVAWLERGRTKQKTTAAEA
jgi:hypothetical protein